MRDVSNFRKRSRLSLIVNILNVADTKKGGVVKTHLMYRAYLNYRMLTASVNFLLEEGLLEEKWRDDGYKQRIYVITQKGSEFLETYNSLIDLVGGSKKFATFSNDALQDNLSI